MSRTTFAAICASWFLPALAQGGPGILQREEPQPSVPAYTPVAPAPPNHAHFAARAADLLAVLRANPTAKPMRDARIAGVSLYPADVITPQAIALFDAEGGKFDEELRDESLYCDDAPVLPAEVQTIILKVNSRGTMTMPVFLESDVAPPSYLELSLDQPGLPVLLKVSGYDAVALRVTTSARTRLAAVRLDSYYPGIVLGVDPKLVTQHFNGRDRFGICPGGKKPAGITPAAAGPEAVTYKADRQWQIAIGDPQPVNRSRPTLGNFFDPQMPVTNQYGLAVLASRGYIRPASRPPGQGIDTDVLEVLKPFRIPEGLAGAHQVTFIVLPGVEVPSGDLAHSHMLRPPG